MIQNIKNVPETTGTFFVKSIKRYRTNITATAIGCPLLTLAMTLFVARNTPS